MTNSIIEAEVYFENLWQQNKKKWLIGDLSPAVMENGVALPLDFCLSTVARLVEQENAPKDIIASIVDELKQIANDQFFYPEQSRHITLIGCTQRALNKEAFTNERRKRLLEVCESVISKSKPVQMRIKGVGILANQVFLQVMPLDNSWEKLRIELADILRDAGESAITYSNMKPIHMNIIRITNASEEKLIPLLNKIEFLRNKDFGAFEVSNVNFVLTDFVLSSGNVEFLSKINFAGS